MLKIMTKKAYDAALTTEVQGFELLAETRKQANEELRKRLGDAHANLQEATKMLAEQAAAIKEMAPFADLGRRRQQSEDRRNARKRAKRAAKRAGL